MKTNKAYQKRIKITKNGRLLARKSGQNHFNAKERHGVKSTKGRGVELTMSNKERSRYLVNI